MSRLKPKALSNPPSQTTLEGGSESARPLTANTVASTPAACAQDDLRDGSRSLKDDFPG